MVPVRLFDDRSLFEQNKFDSSAKHQMKAHVFEAFECSTEKCESKNLQGLNIRRDWRDRSSQLIRSEISERKNMCVRSNESKERKRDENENKETRRFS